MHHQSTSISPEVLARLAAADPSADAFRELDDWARPRLRRYFVAGGFSRADADDLVQQTLLRLLRGLPQLRDPQKLIPWLFAIARRVRAGAWARGRGERDRQASALPMEDLPALHAEVEAGASPRVRDEQPYQEIAAALQVGNVHHGPPREAGIPRIPVRLLAAGGGVVAETRTDRNGLYSFRGACAGAYTICPGTPCPTGGAAPSRYSPETRSVEVPPAAVRGLDFLLLEPPPLGIDVPFPAH